jgi:opacity protein-like surface antigen
MKIKKRILALLAINMAFYQSAHAFNVTLGGSAAYAIAQYNEDRPDTSFSSAYAGNGPQFTPLLGLVDVYNRFYFAAHAGYSFDQVQHKAYRGRAPSRNNTLSDNIVGYGSLGYQLIPQQASLYFNLGYAQAKISYQLTNYFSKTANQSGLLVGIGSIYNLNNNWNVFIEGNYFNYNQIELKDKTNIIYQQKPQMLAANIGIQYVFPVFFAPGI